MLQTDNRPAPKARIQAAAIRTSLFIGGESVDGDGSVLSVVNPSTEEIVATFSGASADQVGQAVDSARAAFEDTVWSDPSFRRRTLHRFANLIEEHAHELMDVLIQEIGTPVSLKANQVDIPVEFLRWFAEAATKDWARPIGTNGRGTATGNIVRRPVGVVAAITAYNYPLQIAVTKIGAAFAAGCTAVLLSSPQAPLALLMLGDLATRAGFPPGVLNILAGGADIGRALSEHSGVDKVSFTGSVDVGRKVMQQAALGLHGVVLELGGKSAAIMLPGVDYRQYALSLHARYARHAGQGCGSPTRILVEEARLSEFIAISREVYGTIKVGDPKDPSTIVGPLISAAQRNRVEAYIAGAIAAGATIAAGGGRPAEPKGWFVNPTLVSGIGNDAQLAREEIFGPVSVLLTYRDIDEAIAIANDSDLGLKAYLYGPSDLCLSLAQQLRVGTVVINGGGGLRPDAPMCGYKKSGIGREWGEDGVLEFLETQHIDCAMTAA
jgi:aldehyde dehydrogenase (NAD+)